MSASKRKVASEQPSEVQDVFDTINDIVIKVKQKLASTSTPSPSLVDDLHVLASLGESFTEKRQRANKRYTDLANALDREGVYLWNASGLYRQDSEKKLYASLRYAGYRLIEAGLEYKPLTESLIHMLQLASKTGADLSETGYNGAAAGVLTCAAKFEDQLRRVDETALAAHREARARAVTVYYCSRMQAAWRDGNEAVSQFMLEKITDGDEALLSLLPAHDRETLATKILEIGKSVMRTSLTQETLKSGNAPDARKAHDAVKWIQRALTLIEGVELSESPTISNLKRSILRALARAYYLSSPIDSESLIRAETTLDELLTLMNSPQERTSPDYQQLRWLQLAIMKRRKAPTAALLEAFTALIGTMALTESEMTDILQELRTLSQHHSLVTSVLLCCLKRVLDVGHDRAASAVERLLVFFTFHVSRDPDHRNAMKDLDTVCTQVVDAGYELKKTPATACLSVLWQFGDKKYQSKDWSQAADWFLSGTHPIFATVADISRPKCYKKAALCYIEKREYAQASAIIRRCPSGQSSVYYIAFLIAAQQGLEEEAISAVKDMVKAIDFDKKLLLLATQLAHEADLKLVLLHVLEALLEVVRAKRLAETQTESIVLVRCIIRVVLRLLKQPGANQSSLIDALIRHFHTAIACIHAAKDGSGMALIAKDISWLWRTAYNTAIQGCAEWENGEGKVADVFEVAYELLLASSDISTTMDSQLQVPKIYALFGTVCGRVFAFRSQATILETKTFDQIEQYYALVRDVIEGPSTQTLGDGEDLEASLHIVRVFEVELRSQRKEWDTILKLVENSRLKTFSLNTYEAIADILWIDPDCPIPVLYAALEAILHVCLDKSALSLDKFSRWLRAICTILLARNSQSDRAKAISYVEQAASVMDDNSNSESTETYPPDEVMWLLATTYNTGVECLAGSFHVEAKRWFESSATLCRFVPDGAQRSRKITATYQELLSQYASSATIS